MGLFQNLVLGGKVIRSYGAVQGAKARIGHVEARVHLLQVHAAPTVSLEINFRSLLAFQSQSVQLDPSAASELINLLQRAVTDAQAGLSPFPTSP